MRFIDKLDLSKLDSALWPLYAAFICFNFLDIYTTSIAMGE